MVRARRAGCGLLAGTEGPDAAFPINDIHAAGYGAIWHGQTSWNGVAILAKGMDPLESRRGLPGGGGDTHSRYARRDRRLPVPAERQPAAWSEIPLQTGFGPKG